MVKYILIFLLTCSNAFGQIVLSEVLSNEPSGMVRLEWIELYNRDDNQADLGDYYLIADSDTNYFETGTIIPPSTYLILARQLLPENGSDSFEGYWGDSTGIWGDSEIENYPAFDIDITLSNTDGNIRLVSITGSQPDYVEWDHSSDDGRSIERDNLFDDNSGWHDCFDISGSTPGRVNSEIPVGGSNSLNVTIDHRTIKRNSDTINIDIIIPAGSKLTVDIFDETGKKHNRLLDESTSAVVTIQWDGSDETGKMLRPGPYIVGLFLSGQKTDSKIIPVVIAP